MIELSDLQKVLDQTTVVDIPSLQVKDGEIAAIFGSVDSGKEVLFQILTGSVHPTRGKLLLAGVDPYHDRKAFSRMVGVLFAENTLYKRLSVIGNLLFYCRLFRLPKSRAIEVLEQVGLADQAVTSAEKLSPGLSRRLALGRVVLNNPKVLILVDPFAGCEQVSIELISQIVRKQAETGVAVLIFNQDTTNLEGLCNRVYHLGKGRIIEAYNPREEQQNNRPFMIPARVEDKIVLVDPAEILYVFAQEDHTYLQTLEGRLPTRFTLTELEKRLSRSGFFRAHRAYLVNLQQVKEIVPYTRDSFSLRLKDSDRTEIPLSKSAERELRNLLEY